jgi:hypothetical protein
MMKSMAGSLQAIAELGEVPGPREEQQGDHDVEEIEHNSTLCRAP